MKKSTKIALIITVVLWGIGTAVLYQNGSKNAATITSGIILILGLVPKSERIRKKSEATHFRNHITL